MRKRCGGRAREPDEKEIQGQNGERQIFANKEKTNICKQGEYKYLPTRRRQIFANKEKTNIVRKRIFSRLREKRQISAKPRMTRPDRTGQQLAK